MGEDSNLVSKEAMEAMAGVFNAPAVVDAKKYLKKNGYSLEADASQARLWCEAKVDTGDVEAMYVLACLYAYGFGGEKYIQRAISLCRQAASNGYLRASLLLASLLICGEKLSEEDLKEANKLLEDASDKGDMDARYSMALLALNGIGRERDRGYAILQLEDLVKQGYTDAKCALATELFNEGSTGATKRAIDLVIEAADANDPLANYLLANFYLSGIHGFPKDEEKSQFYIQRIGK